MTVVIRSAGEPLALADGLRLTLAALLVTLGLTALVALAVPARRAGGVDPLTVLRHE